jgi:hypothetical protein
MASEGDRMAQRRSAAPASGFRGRLEPVPHGGLYVIVPAKVAEAARLRHGARVRGTVNGVAYRSSLMKYSGVFHMGVHKATVAAAGVGSGARVEVTIEIDDQPLPGDVVPDDLREALARVPRAAASWEALTPSHRREHVKSVLDAKHASTRHRRIAAIVETLESGPPPRRTWATRPRS